MLRSRSLRIGLLGAWFGLFCFGISFSACLVLKFWLPGFVLAGIVAYGCLLLGLGFLVCWAS